MSKRGKQRGAGKASQPRTLRASKRKLSETEESTPTGEISKLQPEKPDGTSICELASSELKENSAPLTMKDVKAKDSYTEANLPSDLKKDRGTSLLLEAGDSNMLGQRGGPMNEALSDTEHLFQCVLEEVTEKRIPEMMPYSERGSPQQHVEGHLNAMKEAKLRGVNWVEEDADIQHHCCAKTPHVAQCPPGCRSPPLSCDRGQVGKRSRRADGVTECDGEDNRESQHLQLQEGAGVHPSGQHELGEGKGAGSTAEKRGDDGPPRKKVRKRMGMWGFGDRERRSHCEGQRAGRNLRKVEPDTARERVAKSCRQEEDMHLGCHREIMDKSQEVSTCKMMANNTHLRTSEETLDAACGPVSQPGAPPSGPSLYVSTPSSRLDSIPEEEEPSQPESEGPSKDGERRFPAGETITLVTEIRSSAVSTERATSSEDTPHCGMGEATAEYLASESGGGSKAASAELGDASCDGGRHVANPCAVQEEDCDLSITVLEKEEQDRCSQEASCGKEEAKVRANSSELRLSPAKDLPGAASRNAPCGAVTSKPPDCASQLDPNDVTTCAGTEASLWQEAVAEVQGCSAQSSGDVLGSVVRVQTCSAQGSGDVLGSVEIWSDERAGQESLRDRVTLFPDSPAAGNGAEPPEPQEDVKTFSNEDATVAESRTASATRQVATDALPKERWPPCYVTVSVDVHVAQAGRETETQMVSDQVSLSGTNLSPDQQPAGEDGVRLDTAVDSRSVQETGGDGGCPDALCASVSAPTREDGPSLWNSQLVQNVSAESPKPGDDPDFDPGAPLSLGSLSDSQLNNIALSEMVDSAVPGFTEEQEDATELVCGLIKELSSLNRTVMAAHRELDNLRRGNKVSKLPHRQLCGSRPTEM